MDVSFKALWRKIMQIKKTLFSAVALSFCVLTMWIGTYAQTTSSLQPYIVPRGGWKAAAQWPQSDSSCKESNGSITNTFIHHTSSEDSWTEAISRGNEYVWVRLIQESQMTRGNCDIAYHYLIGPSGTIFEGRQGGIRTKGGHLLDMNSGTIGIAMLGNFDNSIPTPSAILSLQKLLVWLLLDNNLEPEGLNYVKYGYYYSPVISGHRHINWSPNLDNHTSCPGNALFNYLPTLRQSVNTRIRNLESSYLFKTSNNPTIYRVRNSVKNPFPSSYVYNSYYGNRWDYVRVKDSAFLGSYSTGGAIPFRDGTLLGYSDRSWDSTIFVVYNGKKRAFTSWSYFLELGGRYQLGYSSNKIMRVPGAVIDQIPRGPDMVNIVRCIDCTNT
jgi:hypothetical protein